MFDKTILIKGLVVAFGGSAAIWCSGALAQDAPNSPAPSDVQRVLVTGSNVRRTDSETPSPVQVITAEDIKASGYTSIADVLHSITANGQGTLSQGFSQAFASGAAGVSLRGLNTAATLVLIDGHRSAPYPIGDDGQRSFVDIANIPFDSVERIEVLKDGASAIYGSDAIAGVVNIILKKSYNGGKLSADLGTSYRGDGTTKHASGIFGMGDLTKDGYNAYVSGEIRRQNQIRYKDRGNMFNQTDFTSTGGLDTTRGVPVQETNGGLPGSATGYVTDPNGNILGFMPGCNATTFAAGQCTYKNTWSQIVPTTTNYNGVARFTKQLPADWQVSVEGTYFESKSQQVGAPSSTFTAGYQGITSGPGVTPSLTASLPATTIPSTNPSFPTGTGATSGILYYNFLDLGPTVTTTDAKTTRLVADLNGSLGNWDMSASAGFTQVRLALRGYNNVSAANLQEALDSTTDPYLVGQKNDAAVDAFIAPTLTANDKSTLSFFHAGASHDLWDLPGGPMSLALGLDYVHRTQYSVAPASVASGDISSFSNNFTIGTQNVASVDAELVAPILKTLEAEAAVRYDHYNLSGGKASPKIGMKWTPVSEFALRGTASRGFRAPGPAENGTAGQTFFATSQFDPVLCPGGDATTAGNFPSQCAIQVGSVQSTNPKLKPETSKSYTLGTIIEPVKDISASVDLYYIQIDNQIVSGGATTTVRGTNLTPLPQTQADGSTTLVTPPVAPIAYYSVGYINANSTTTSGVDMDFEARHRFDFGEVKSNVMITYMNKYDTKIDGITYHLAGTHGPLIVGGDTGSPKTRIKWANTFSRGPVSVTGTLSFVSGYSLTDPSVGVDDCATGLTVGAGYVPYQEQLNAGTVPSALSCKVHSFTTFDLEGHYDVTKHLTLDASVVNLFDSRAPHDWGTYGGNVAPYNPSLHQEGAIGPYFTVGGSYTF